MEYPEDGFPRHSVEDWRWRWYCEEISEKTWRHLCSLSDAEWAQWESLAHEMNHKRHNPNWVQPVLPWWQQDCLDAMNKMSPPDNPAPVRKTFAN
jgi:hypothetical protein